jgi:hypothetical protein
MTGYYIGIEVELLEEHGDGWVSARWANGKTYRHWATQIKTEPFGSVSLSRAAVRTGLALHADVIIAGLDVAGPLPATAILASREWYVGHCGRRDGVR